MKKFILILNMVLLYSYLLIANTSNFINSPDKECLIYDLTLESTVCENDLFSVILDFRYENVSDSFMVHGNGINYGNFKYSDLPLRIDSLNADCETNFEFEITDIGNSTCYNFIELGEVCCPGDCLISNLQLSNGECQNNKYHTVTIDYDNENPENDYYEVWISGNYYGALLISKLPISLEVKNLNFGFDHVLVCIKDVQNCCLDGIIANPCYNSGGECQIYNVVGESITCDNGFFDVLINCQHEFNSDSFSLQGNGVMYGHYAYSELPILIEGLPADCKTNYKFIIADLVNTDCYSDTELGVICCRWDCNISNFHVNRSSCRSDNSHSIIIDFDIEDTKSTNYYLWIGSDFVGNFLIDDLPQYFDLISTTNKFDKVKIKLNDIDSCFIVTNISNPCYLPIENCDTTNLNIFTSDCTAENYHTLTVDFDAENPGNAIYEISINSNEPLLGMVAGLPSTFTIGNTINEYDNVFFCIQDVDSCSVEGKILNPCYVPPGDCNIKNVTAEITLCGYELIDVLINCQYDNTSDSFRIEGNNMIYGQFAYADLPILVEDLLKLTPQREFNIVDKEKLCQAGTILGTQSTFCHYNSLSPFCQNGQIWSGWTFVDDIFDIDTISLIVNGQYFGTLNYAPDSIYYFGFDNPGTEYILLELCSGLWGYGRNSIKFVNPCYISAEVCMISDVVADDTLCENGLFSISINCQNEFTSDSFRIQGNGVIYGHFAYSDLPILIDGLAADCETNYEFIIIDLENNDCYKTLNYGLVCCENECSITNLNISTSECSSENDYSVTIDFNYETANNNFFDLWVDDIFIGKYNLNVLPYSVSFNDNGNQYAKFVVCINDQPDCCAEANILNPCYNSVECVISEITTDVSDCENMLFNVFINFDHQNTSDSFRIQRNGVMYGNFSYNQLPILQEGLNGDCVTNYEFVITDLVFEECQISTNIGTICCGFNFNQDNVFVKNNVSYLYESRQIMLDLKDNQYDMVNISVYNLLGQKLNETQLINASGEYFIDVTNDDHIQFAKVEMYKDMNLVDSEKVKIVKH